MIEFARILALTDGSQNSRSAFRYAITICKKFGARLDILLVIEDMPAYVSLEVDSEFLVQIQDAMRREMEDCINYCRKAGVETNGVIRHGVPYEEIEDYARENDIDLIVMATHGHTGLSHILLGSVAEKIIRHAPCPVLTTRIDEKSKDWDIDRETSGE
ncbi:MAG: universal stress protein [Deltaproteobacteria bacterium]|nr:universal stress protein [Deltaproteobacteria bacterium]